MGMLEGKVAVITGGLGGIGLATAILFHREGATVHSIDRDTSIQGSLPAELMHGRFTAHRADVTHREELRTVIATVMQSAPAIDILVCNAGISGDVTPVADYAPQVFANVIGVHVMGTFNTVQAALPHVPDEASIIITSSVAGLIGPPRVSAYATAKHAQIGFMRSLAAELAPRHIRVNTINPGPVNNEFQNDIEERTTGLDVDAANATFDEMIPLGRHAEPEEIAQGMLFLAGPHSRMITSTVFRIDGGMAG